MMETRHQKHKEQPIVCKRIIIIFFIFFIKLLIYYNTLYFYIGKLYNDKNITKNYEKMNNNKKTKTTKAIIASVAIMIVIASASMILGIQTQMSQHALAQTNKTTTANASGATTMLPTNPSQSTNKTAASASGAITMLPTNPVIVNPSQSTNKEFWINTVHFDGASSLHAALANPLSAQNTPLHPAEVPPANSTIPTGGGFRIVLPNKVGAWDFRSFTFAPDQIIVNQGDNVSPSYRFSCV